MNTFFLIGIILAFIIGASVVGVIMKLKCNVKERVFDVLEWALLAFEKKDIKSLEHSKRTMESLGAEDEDGKMIIGILDIFIDSLEKNRGK